MIQIVKLFTKSDYEKFVQAATSKTNWEFRYRKGYTVDPKTKISLYLYVRECYNGVWKDNLMGGMGFSDARKGMHGRGSPFQIAERTPTYNEIIDFWCKGLKLPRMEQEQLSFI